MRRFDRWLLLRAPMLWRTRLPHLLVLLSLAVIATIPFMQTSITVLIEVVDLASVTMSIWWLQLYGAVGVLVVWVVLVIRKPVGELAPRRHIVTVAAVTFGSYLWLVTPSLLAYPQINKIKQVGPSDPELYRNYEVVSIYRGGASNCVENAIELEQLPNVLALYNSFDVDLNVDRKNEFCEPGGASLSFSFHVNTTRIAIETIMDARGIGPNSKSQFYAIWIGHTWWFAAALGIGILTAFLSYPLYVWRRIFLWR